MKTIYTLFGVAALAAVLMVSAGTATAGDEWDNDDFYEVIDDALYEDTDRS